MIITLKSSTGSPTDLVLVHGAGKPSDTYAQGPIGDEVFESAVMIQTVGIIRARAARVRSRGNRTAVYPFGALREFATHTAARVWAAGHAAALDGYNQLALSDGSTVLLTGALTPVRCNVRGVAVMIEYTFNYGAVS